MTNDEAKAHIKRLRKRSIEGDIDINHDETDALDVALWWAEREPYVHAVVAANLVGDLEDAHSALFHWESEHPRPGSLGDVLTAEPGEWIVEGHTARRVGPKPGS